MIIGVLQCSNPTVQKKGGQTPVKHLADKREWEGQHEL